MAQASYTSASKVTLANMDVAHARLITALQHFSPMGIHLVSIVVNADRTVTITVDGAIPQEQVDHLGLLL